MLDLLPINDLPHFLQEGGPHVLVVQVVRVFPHINRHQRNVVSSQVGRCVLVRCLSVLKRVVTFVVQQPTPTRTLHTDGLLGKISLEVLDGAPFTLNHQAKWTGLIRQCTTALLDGCKSFPEKLVVQVTATVELESLAQVHILLDVSLSKRLGRLLVQCVEIVDVSAVMFSVVELHQVTGDNRLQSAEIVGQMLELNHNWLSSSSREGLL